MNFSKEPDQANFDEYFSGRSIFFIGRLSFERRCQTAYRKIKPDDVAKKLFFKSLSASDLENESQEDLNIEDSDVVEIDIFDPLQIQRAILEGVLSFSKPHEREVIVLDITSFRREELLIIVQSVLRLSLPIRNRFYFVYSVASSMADWLSRNVKQVRPVIGYPGDVSANRNSHLVILAGIEHDRVLSIIDAYEPTIISLGYVPLDESVSASLHERNLELRDHIVNSFDNIALEFKFSAKNPRSVISSLHSVIEQLPNYNTIIAPLNTKLSTLGCGIYAVENPIVQLCYAEVGVYNVQNYSEVSEEVIITPLSSFEVQ